MGSTIRLYYDTIVAIALMAVFAIVCGFVAAVITGGSPPNFTIAGIAFCSPARFGSSASGAILRPADGALGPRGRLPRTTLRACLALQGAVMSFQTIPMFADEETPDGFALRGSEIASLLDGTPCQMGSWRLSAGSACWFAPLMSDKRR